LSDSDDWSKGNIQMKALTIIEPHATLIMIGVKPYETRSWETSFRGFIAIHAGKGTDDLYLPKKDPYRTPLVNAGYLKPTDFHLGCVLGVVKLVDCIPAEKAHDKTFGGFEAGRFAWKLEVVEVFPKPIPAKGALGLWEWKFDRALIQAL
jgi:activating signal cointegrator 1